MAFSVFFRMPLHEVRRLTVAEFRAYCDYMDQARAAADG